MTPARRRALLLAIAMGSTALLGQGASSRKRSDADTALDLERIVPLRFAEWQLDTVAAAFVRPAGELANRLYQQLLERTFVGPRGHRMMLSMAYGRDQSSGLELHWPEVCYRYGGYAVYGRHSASIRTDGRDVPVARMMAELPSRPEPVTYWGVLGGERVADAQTFRLRRLAHAVRREAADGLLVRVSSIDPLPQRAYELQARFIDEMVQAIAPSDRARIVGLPPQG